MNWFLLPTLVLAAGSAWLGTRQRGGSPARLALLAAIAGLPALLYWIYYLHWFDDACWFVGLRALPGSELLAAGIGWPLGLLLARVAPRWRWLRAPLIAGVGFVVIVPYLKPLLLPLDHGVLVEHWVDGVCLQSSASTCGPASAASVLRHLGIQSSEAELARACFTGSSGTEAWYLIRELRRRGCTVTVRSGALPDELRLPAIAGVRVGSTGHFIAILDRDPAGTETADPMIGRRIEPPARLALRQWTGFAIEISRGGQPAGRLR